MNLSKSDKLGNSGRLLLEDGTVFPGWSFGYPQATPGEIVFNTGMVGYPEALTDPSYRGQILALTYPLIGNYGVPGDQAENGLAARFESSRMQIAGLIVSEAADKPAHWNATRGLAQWLQEQQVPALSGVDTRALTKHLREHGSMLGKLLIEEQDVEPYDPNSDNLVAQVSVTEPVVYAGGKTRVVVIDCGCKNSIIQSLLSRGVTVIRVPWNYDFTQQEFHGVLISNGPGDPKHCQKTISSIRQVLAQNIPTFGICLGHQLLALAAGADTYKLKFGHRGHNQPCNQDGTQRCYITSQNHGYAVDGTTLPAGWQAWFTNANDNTNEGIQHMTRPFMSVQFHPEAAPGPVDTHFLFDQFVGMLL